MGGCVEFDWDAENLRHLKRHRVGAQEFEELITGDPLYLEYQTAGDEERYKVLGATKAGRLLFGRRERGESGLSRRTKPAAYIRGFIWRAASETEARDSFFQVRG